MPTTTFALVVQRIAEAAAHHVTHDQQAANHFFVFNFQATEQRVMENFIVMFRRVLSRVPSDEELNAMMELWDEVYDLSEEPEMAWQAVVTYLFRHPDFLTY